MSDRANALDQLFARDRLGDPVRQADEFSELERDVLGHALAGWSIRTGMPVPGRCA